MQVFFQDISDKFTLMGDYGFVLQNLDETKFTEKYNIGIQKISNLDQNLINKIRYRPFNTPKLADQQKLQYIVNKAQQELINEIVMNRRQTLTASGYEEQKMLQIFRAGIVDPVQSVSLGLIDGIANLNDLIDQHYSDSKILKMNEPRYPHPIMNFMHNPFRYLKSV